MAKKNFRHLIFFDDTCSLCWRSVHKIHALDKKGIFQFFPLRDELARLSLKARWEELKNANTLILLENCHLPARKVWIRGRAVMRILWLLGGWWKLLGWLAFLPCGVDMIYALVAQRRHRL
jgi:predicted DCC family thiol-disulfide oxidoreductase YuxK